MENLGRSKQPQRSSEYGSSFSDDSGLQGFTFQSVDYGDSIELSSISMDTPRSSSSLTRATRGLAAEVRHLKLEIKQAMYMYPSACKEVVTAAVEAVEASHRIAELEVQKRLHSERKTFRELEEKKKKLHTLDQYDIRYRKYTIEDFEVATTNFAVENKIGEGSYGPVFKAYLDHTPVAI